MDPKERNNWAKLMINLSLGLYPVRAELYDSDLTEEEKEEIAQEYDKVVEQISQIMKLDEGNYLLDRKQAKKKKK